MYSSHVSVSLMNKGTGNKGCSIQPSRVSDSPNRPARPTRDYLSFITHSLSSGQKFRDLKFATCTTPYEFEFGPIPSVDRPDCPDTVRTRVLYVHSRGAEAPVLLVVYMEHISFMVFHTRIVRSLHLNLRQCAGLTHNVGTRVHAEMESDV